MRWSASEDVNHSLQTRTFLCVLVEAAHLYIRLMENYCDGNSHMIVQQKKKKGKPGKKKVRDIIHIIRRNK